MTDLPYPYGESSLSRSIVVALADDNVCIVLERGSYQGVQVIHEQGRRHGRGTCAEAAQCGDVAPERALVAHVGARSRGGRAGTA